MYPQLLLSSVLINFVVANDQNLIRYGDENKKSSALENKYNLGFPKWKQHFWKPSHKTTTHNISYIETAENMIRIPAMNKLNDNKNNKKKLLRKSPKRTIQKIIKKNRQRSKKLYIMKMTSPTVSPESNIDLGQDEMAQWKDESTTTPPNQKKKPRKYNSKIARYPMPFHSLKKMKPHRRDRREVFNREDLYILKDFNELKFLQGDKDFSVVNARIKNYW